MNIKAEVQLSDADVQRIADKVIEAQACQPAQEAINLDKLHTLEGVAQALNQQVTTRQVKEMIARGDLYIVQIGNTKYVPQRSITAWLERVHDAQQHSTAQVVAKGTDSDVEAQIGGN